MTVACYHCYLVCIVDCEVGVDEDKDIRYRFGEGQSWGKECPCVRIRIDDDCQKRGRGACT